MCMILVMLASRCDKVRNNKTIVIGVQGTQSIPYNTMRTEYNSK